MERPIRQPAGATPLEPDECRQRLAEATKGYLATTARALPVILPVGIAADDGRLVLTPLFTSHLGMVPGTVQADTVVALAVGTLGNDREWCVVAQGVLHDDAGDGPGGACHFEPELLTGWCQATPPC